MKKLKKKGGEVVQKPERKRKHIPPENLKAGWAGKGKKNTL